jgi:hypothetical protein
MMPSITLSVSVEIKKLMEKFPEMNWSGFIRKVIEQKTKELSWQEDMLRQLRREQEHAEWAVGLQRKSRTNRVAKLKKKGLL